MVEVLYLILSYSIISIILFLIVGQISGWNSSEAVVIPMIWIFIAWPIALPYYIYQEYRESV